jgi:hypothetical protein
MCKYLKDFQILESEVLCKISETAEEVKKSESIKKKARFYASLKILKDFIEDELKFEAPTLINENVSEFFENENLKVFIKNGGIETKIDSHKLYDEMRKQERVYEFVKIAKISESDLKNIDKGAELIKIAKIETGKVRASSVMVSELSKDDKKRLAEEKIIKGE